MKKVYVVLAIQTDDSGKDDFTCLKIFETKQRAWKEVMAISKKFKLICKTLGFKIDYINNNKQKNYYSIMTTNKIYDDTFKNLVIYVLEREVEK